jgi:diguanylate cyclase (GGDEF)-like protein/PAS domain S-box-containing protein
MRPQHASSLPLPPASLLPRWGWLTLLLVVLVGSGLSLAAWRYSVSTEQEANRIRFERRVDETVGELRQRLEESVRLLRSTAALFAASSEVGRGDWKAFADAQSLDTAFPGLLGIGHAALVPPEELERVELAMRMEGFWDYAVWPPGPRPMYAPVLYREPLTPRNQRALGFDMLSDPVRREAMERARDSGEPALSAGTVLLLETDKSRFANSVLFLPVYTKLKPLGTLAQRREAITGWVYAPIHVTQLMGTLVQRRADDMLVELFDGTPGGPTGQPLFEAHRDTANSIPRFQPSHSAERRLAFGGREWTVRLAALPTFDASQPSSRAQLILAGGLAITLLMALLVGALLNMRGRALALARRLSGAYRASEARVRTVLDNAAEGIVTVDRDGGLRSANPIARALLGLPAGELGTLHLPQLLPIDMADLQRHFISGPEGETVPRQWRRQATLSLPNGQGELSLLLAASEVRLDDGQPCFVLLLSDVTELKRARAQADQASALNETILACAPFCVIATDRHGLIRSVNAAGERMLGYCKGELLGRHAKALHLPEELALHAARLSAEMGQPVEPDRALGLRAMLGQRDELECTYVRKDGSHLPVMAAVSPLLDSEGRQHGFLGIAYDITERKRSETYIRHMAHHDELTGLPNRTLLQERALLALETLRPQGRTMGVLLLDLDRFKQINDSLGHQAGDVVLCSVAARLKHCLRSSDTVARMGGDEFVILLPHIDSPQQAERVAAKVLNAMVEPIQAGHHRLTVTPSIGIACFPHDGDDLATLLRNADVAMYQSKSGGRNSYTAYTPQMHTASAKRLELEGELRLALERNELALHYQPLVQLDTGEVVGVEALLRWSHPQRGAVSPADFIPIAEDTGLIVSIGEWVLRTACRDMRLLQQRTGRRLKVAVNLSPRQLRAPNLSAVIADALARAGWAPQDLELEITESMVIDNPDASIEAMQRLCAMGLGLAIDDFGTGYSSLSYLTRFPVAKLKLDRSFVRGLPDNHRDAAIATSVVAMGHGLKLQVLAEGIETEAQMQFLRGLGCEMGQGWLFAKAMPLEALAAHLTAQDRLPLLETAG